MASIKASHQKLSQNEDEMESNRGSKKPSNFLKKWIIIGLFIFFFFILLVLITALCLVFIEVMSVQQQQQQPVSIAKIKPSLVFELEDSSKEKPVLIENIAKPEPLVPSDADRSQIVQQPTDQQVELGKEAILSCKFDYKVHCRWLRKSNLVDISTRYSYIEAEEEDGNSDCSIKLTKIKKIDLSDWQCVGVFDDQSSLASNIIKLQITPVEEQIEVALITLPQDVTTEIGEDVQFDCKFNEKVSCAWLRRGEHIEIQGRYEFIEQLNDVDGRRADCSITISEVKKIDEGNWMCSSMADSNSSGTTSLAVKLALSP